MADQDLATALRRVESVLERRPEFGQQPDTPATARWAGGTRVLTHHANGTHVTSDMPAELGGRGDAVSPGWLMRAGIGACAATSIVMEAARAGIALAQLEVEVNSRSDTRGLLGMRGDGGARIEPGPLDMRLDVRIGAPGVAAERVRALVQQALECSPVPCTVRAAVPMQVQVDVIEAQDGCPL